MLFSTELCEACCDFSITISIFFSKYRLRGQTEQQREGKADFLGNNKVAQELINYNQVSLSRRAIIYSRLLCFYDYGSWLLVPIYSSGAMFGDGLSTQNCIQLLHLYPNQEVICTLHLMEIR